MRAFFVYFNVCIFSTHKTLRGVYTDWCIIEACGLGSYNFNSFEPATEEQLLAMRRVSPIHHVQKVITPTLVCLGGKDKRVPPSQGWEYHHVLKAQGVETRYAWVYIWSVSACFVF